jgi:hypothetical protein
MKDSKAAKIKRMQKWDSWTKGKRSAQREIQFQKEKVFK